MYQRLLLIAALFLPLILLGSLVVPHIASSVISTHSRGQSSIGSSSLLGRSAAQSPQLTNPPAGVYFDHVVMIMMENEGISNICGGNPPPCNGPYSPYMSGLANSYGIGSRYLSIFHVSLPNYLGLIGGTTNGCTTTSGCPIMTGPNMVDRLESAGLTWRGYMESQSVAAGCDQITSEPYETDHNPFIHFQDILNNTARCNKVLLANPTSCGATTDCVLINHLNNASAPAPNFMWLTPNDCNNMRSTYSTICSNGCVTPGNACITAGDNYLKSLIPNILNSRTFTTTRSALFITFDEGIGYCPLNNSAEDCLYSVWAGSGAKTGFVTSTLYNQYSPTKTLEVNWNLPSLTSNDANARPMTEFFKTPPPDIGISASPPSLTISASATSNSTITLTSINNFTGTVTLSSSSSPAGLTRVLSPASVTLPRGGTSKSTIFLSSATAGNYTATVIGTSGSLSRNATVRVQVVDFAITANPTIVMVKAGTMWASTVTITSLNHFTGAVTLRNSVSSGLTCGVLSPGSISGGSGSATISCSADTVSNYTLIITGSNGVLAHSVSIIFRVSDFGITGNPASLVVPLGSNSTSTIILTSLGGYSGNVTIIVSSVSGVTAPGVIGPGASGHVSFLAPLSSIPIVSISPTVINLGPGGQGRSVLNVTLSQNVPPGNYTVTLTAKDGSLSHSTYITIVATDFRFVSQPATVTLSPGGSTSTTVWLQGFNTFQNTVNLTVQNPTGGPQGVLNSSAVNVNSTGPSGVGLTITVPSTTPPGNYTVTIVASWRGITRTLNIIVSVRSTPAGRIAAISYSMNHGSLAESALVGLIVFVSLFTVMPRSGASEERRVIRSCVFQRRNCSTPSMRQQDLAWLMKRA